MDAAITLAHACSDTSDARRHRVTFPYTRLGTERVSDSIREERNVGQVDLAVPVVVGTVVIETKVVREQGDVTKSNLMVAIDVRAVHPEIQNRVYTVNRRGQSHAADVNRHPCVVRADH